MSRRFRPQSSSFSTPRPLLKDQLNLEHPLVKLTQAMDWDELERELGQPLSSEGECPALPTRLMADS